MIKIKNDKKKKRLRRGTGENSVPPRKFFFTCKIFFTYKSFFGVKQYFSQFSNKTLHFTLLLFNINGIGVATATAAAKV